MSSAKEQLKSALAVLLVAMVVVVPDALACTSPIKPGKELDFAIQPRRKLKLVEQTIVDNTLQSSARQKFLITNVDGLTEDEVRSALTQLFENAKSTCRKNPLQGAIIFLYISADTVDGTNWVGRLDASNMVPKIDVATKLLRYSNQESIAGVSRCEKPGTANIGKITFRLDNEVDLPPVKDRKILGTWSYWDRCTLSFEEVKGTTYEVVRCSDCSGGNTGQKVAKKPGNMFLRIPDRNGEYFRILPNGNLGSYDRDGAIDTYLKHTGVWP